MFGFWKKLPDYVTKIGKNRYEVDPDKAYPFWLNKFNLDADQYSLEIARRCFTKDLLDTVGKGFILSIKKNDKWKLSNFEVGQGPDLGAAVFRKYYETV